MVKSSAVRPPMDLVTTAARWHSGNKSQSNPFTSLQWLLQRQQCGQLAYRHGVCWPVWQIKGCVVLGFTSPLSNSKCSKLQWTPLCNEC